MATSTTTKRRQALARWTALLQRRLPTLSLPQAKGLALWSIGIVLARSSSLHAVVLAISFHGLTAAEGPVSAVQNALKQQQFYFGETTGELDDGTRAALRRFQIRHGLPATGLLLSPSPIGA